MRQNKSFDDKNHQTKSDFHTINVEQAEKNYREFFASFGGKQLELDICKEFEQIDFESLLLYEQFLKK